MFVAVVLCCFDDLMRFVYCFCSNLDLWPYHTVTTNGKYWKVYIRSIFLRKNMNVHTCFNGVKEHHRTKVARILRHSESPSIFKTGALHVQNCLLQGC